jgi:hypothetical protein
MGANSNWSDPSAPYEDGTDITPTDAVVIPTTRAVYCPTAGTLRVVMKGGTTVNLTVVAGALLPISVTEIHDTGSSITAVVAFY